jgi:diguanylate cyclase (GGDEF)-like protein
LAHLPFTGCATVTALRSRQPLPCALAWYSYHPSVGWRSFIDQRSDEGHASNFEIALIRAIVEAFPDAMLVVDEHGVNVTHNQRFLDLIGVRSDELPGARAGSVEGVLSEHVLSRVVGRVKAPETFVADSKIVRQPGIGRSGSEMVGVTLERHSTGLEPDRSISGRSCFQGHRTQTDEAALKQLAHTDPLTGVANQRQFFVRAQENSCARRFGRPLSFIMVDIDGFKLINDRWGHATGDDVLKTLCSAWKQIIRQVDLLARVGGEDFAVVLTETDVKQAHVVAEKLRQMAAEQTVRRESAAVQCTISVGVATVTPADATVEESIRRADHALYQAKEQGRNRTEDAA